MKKQHNILNKLKFKLLTLHFLLSTMVFAQWLSVEESNITLAPGESVTINITANASGYELGDYEGSIQLTSNDPENPNIEIPVNMSVLYPIAAVEAESIDFGEAGFNSINNYELPITNGGNYPLEVNSSFSVGYSEFDILNDSLTVQPGDTGYVEIQLTTGLEEMELADTLILTMNDPSASSLLFPVSSTIVPDEHPIITTITDVPADQGGWVTVGFTRSYHDTDTLRNVEIYTVEMDYGEDWVSANSVTAYGDADYTVMVHTPFDQMSDDTTITYIDFRIIAGMEEGNFVSEVEQGYSLDNINPETPEGLEGIIANGTAILSWSEPVDEDFSHFSITRNGEIWGSTTTPEFSDTDLPYAPGFEYAVQSVDVHGNVSDPTEPLVLPNTVTYQIDMHSGANLVSFYALPDDSAVAEVMADLGDNATGVIGEGVAASHLGGGDWVGSLAEIRHTSGYWVKIDTGDILDVTGAYVGEDILYELHEGANLISYPIPDAVGLSTALPNDVECLFTGVIGEGVAASQISCQNWVGSLGFFEGRRGYWAKVSPEVDGLTFSFESPDLVRSFQNAQIQEPPPHSYVQSIYQAFYFIEDMEGIDIEIGDWIIAYNGDNVVGARQWIGAYTDVPAMGEYDESTAGYCEIGDTPTFRVLTESGEMFTLAGNIPAWQNNEIFMISLTGTTVEVPTEFVLKPAFPNPFNPVTTIEFGIPAVETHNAVTLNIYDINGRMVTELLNGELEPGWHTVQWNGDNHSTGLYFVKLFISSAAGGSAGEYQNTQKVMLVK